MSIFLNGIDAKYITMEAGNKLTPGKVCYTSKNCTADDAAEDETFLGVTKAVRGDLATVQIAGFVTLSYSGSIYAPGFHYLAALRRYWIVTYKAPVFVLYRNYKKVVIYFVNRSRPV